MVSWYRKRTRNELKSTDNERTTGGFYLVVISLLA